MKDKESALGHISLKCPVCRKEHRLATDDNITCDKCDTDLSSITFRSAAISTFAAVALGAGGLYSVDRIFLSSDEPNRYPLEVEYALVERCANAPGEPVAPAAYARLRDTCICAVSQATEKVTYEEFRTDQFGFRNVWREGFDEC